MGQIYECKLSGGGFNKQRGFTLLEMLAVFIVISLAIGIIYPVSYRLAEKFESRLQLASVANEEKKQGFMRFVRDEDEPTASVVNSREE